MNRSSIDWDRISSYEGPKSSPGFLLWHDFMRWQREMNGVLKPMGVTQPQFAVLAVIGWLTRDGRLVTQTDVVEFLEMDRVHISQLASGLERMGLIERRLSPSDARAKTVIPTTTGAELLSLTLPMVEQHDQLFFAKD